MDKSKVEAIRSWPEQKSLTEVRIFHGLASFYRHFVPHFSNVISPITDFMMEDKFVWITKTSKDFGHIKEKLISAPILILQNFTQAFELYSDVSKYYSEQNLGVRVRYSTYDIKLYVVVQAIKQWRYYLYHCEFILFTNHNALRNLDIQAKVSSRHATWVAFLQQFTFNIHHQTDKLSRVADALNKYHTHWFL